MRKMLIAAVFLPILLAGCKKKAGDSAVTAGNLTTENMKLLVRRTAPADGTLKWLSVRQFSVSADGKMHALYEESNSFGKPFFSHITFSANGDSLSSREIAPSIVNIVHNNDVSNNWMYFPYTDKLTLAYHPEPSYNFYLYSAFDGTIISSYIDASFGGNIRPCYNGDKIAFNGYAAYFTNHPVMQSQAYFHYDHSPRQYFYLYNHAIPEDTMYENQQRRAFAAEPLDDNNVGMCYIDGSYIYMQVWNRATETVENVDSLATDILKPLYRRISADAWIAARTTRDEQKVIFFIKYLSGAYPSDGVYKYATFMYDKASRKLSAVVTGHSLPMETQVFFDNDGYLVYALPDDALNPYAWSIYKVRADRHPDKIAHISGKEPSFATVNEIREFYGKYYVFVIMPSVTGTTKGPVSYILRID